MAIRVVIADDQRLLRQTFEKILGADPEIEVVGCAADGDEALLQCIERRPDAVLLDVSMPKMDGITASGFIRERAPGIRVLMLTMHGEDSKVRKAMEAGADGYILKDTPAGDLIRIVKAVARGEEVDSPHLADRRLLQFQESVRSRLTEREQRLVSLLYQGKSNSEMAHELFVSEQTVKRDLAHVFEVLGVENRTEAAIRVLELGLAEPSQTRPGDPVRLNR